MELPFLDYIHDDKHPWVVCVGVPFGTHLWQVVDSSELNGAFKMEVTKAETIIYAGKPESKKSWWRWPILFLSWTVPFLNHLAGLTKHRRQLLFLRLESAKLCNTSEPWPTVQGDCNWYPATTTSSVDVTDGQQLALALQALSQSILRQVQQQEQMMQLCWAKWGVRVLRMARKEQIVSEQYIACVASLSGIKAYR